MDWQEKRAAIIALCGAPLVAESGVRKGEIILIPHAESSDTRILTSVSASGMTLAQAYDRLWEAMTGLEGGKHLRISGGARYRWNGYRWAEVETT